MVIMTFYNKKWQYSYYKTTASTSDCSAHPYSTMVCVKCWSYKSWQWKSSICYNTQLCLELLWLSPFKDLLLIRILTNKWTPHVTTGQFP